MSGQRRPSAVELTAMMAERLRTLEAPQCHGSDAVDAYLWTHTALQPADSRRVAIAEIQAQLARWLAVFLRDIRSTSLELAMSALQTLAHVIHNKTVARALDADKAEKILLSLADIVQRTSVSYKEEAKKAEPGKGDAEPFSNLTLCHLALWTLSNQNLVARVIHPCLSTISESLAVCISASFDSVKLYRECANCLRSLLRRASIIKEKRGPQSPVKMHQNKLEQLITVAAALLVHGDPAVSLHSAHVLVRLLAPAADAPRATDMLRRSRSALGRGLVEDVALSQIEAMASTAPLRALQLCIAAVWAAGDILRHTQGKDCLNRILAIAELGFESRDPALRASALTLWWHLTNVFEEGSRALQAGSRQRLLLQPCLESTLLTEQASPEHRASAATLEQRRLRLLLKVATALGGHFARYGVQIVEGAVRIGVTATRQILGGPAAQMAFSTEVHRLVQASNVWQASALVLGSALGVAPGGTLFCPEVQLLQAQSPPPTPSSANGTPSVQGQTDMTGMDALQSAVLGGSVAWLASTRAAVEKSLRDGVPSPALVGAGDTCTWLASATSLGTAWDPLMPSPDAGLAAKFRTPAALRKLRDWASSAAGGLALIEFIEEGAALTEALSICSLQPSMVLPPMAYLVDGLTAAVSAAMALLPPHDGDESQRHERQELLRTLLKTTALLEALTRYCARCPQVNLPLQLCATACTEAIVGGCTAAEFSKSSLRLDFPAVIHAPWIAPPPQGGAQLHRGLKLCPAADSDSVPASALLAAVALRSSPRLWCSDVSPEILETDLALLNTLFQAVFKAPMPFMAILAPLRQLRRALERHWATSPLTCHLLWEQITRLITNQILKTDVCYAGSSSEPDLSAITTLLVLPFDNFGIKATVPLETRQTFLSAWHSLFDASMAACRMNAIFAYGVLYDIARAMSRSAQMTAEKTDVGPAAVLASCAAYVLLATKFPPLATAVPPADLYHSATGSAEGSSSLSSLASRQDLRVRVQVTLAEVINSGLCRLKSTIFSSKAAPGLASKAADVALAALAEAFSSSSSTAVARYLLRAITETMADYMKALRVRGAQSQFPSVKAAVVTLWAAQCDTISSLAEKETVLPLLPELEPLLQEALMHPTRALSEKAINFWNVTFGSEVVVEVSERLRKMLQKLETDAPDAITLPELAPLGSGASLAASLALKRNSQPSSLVEMEDSDEDEASDDEPGTSPAQQAGPMPETAAQADRPILVADSLPPPLLSLDDSKTPEAGDDDIAFSAAGAAAVSAQQPGNHTAASADEEICEIQLVDEKDIQNEDGDDGVEHELSATDEGRHVDVRSGDAGDEAFAIVSPSHSFSPPVSPPPPMRNLPGSDATGRKNPARQPARRSKRKATTDAAEREGDTSSPQKRCPGQSNASTLSEVEKVKWSITRRKPAAKTPVLSSEEDQAAARADVEADMATNLEADAVAQSKPSSPAPRGTLASAADPVLATNEEKNMCVLNDPVPECRASSEPPASRPAAEEIPESAAVQAASSGIIDAHASGASGKADAAQDRDVDVLPSLVEPNTSPVSVEGVASNQGKTKPRGVLTGVDTDASPSSDKGSDPHAQVPLRRRVSLERRPSIGGSRRANLIASMAMGSQSQSEQVDAVEWSASKESVEAKNVEAQPEATRKKRDGAARGGNAGGVLSVGSKRAKRILQSLSAGRLASEPLSPKDPSEEAAAAEASCDSSSIDDPVQLSTPLEDTAAAMVNKEATGSVDLANETKSVAARQAEKLPADAQEAETQAKEAMIATEASGTVCASASVSSNDASAGPRSPSDSSGGAAALPHQASSLAGAPSGAKAAGVAQAGASSVDNDPSSKTDRSGASGQRRGGSANAGANMSTTAGVLRPLPEKTPSREPDVEQTTPRPPSSAQAPPGAPAGKSAARRLGNSVALSAISNDVAANLNGGKEAEKIVAEYDAERRDAPTPSEAPASAAVAPQSPSSPPPESPPATAAAEDGAASSDMPTISTQSQLEMEEVLGKVIPGSPGHRSRAKRSFIGRVGNGALSPRKLSTSWLSKSKRHPVAAAPSALPDSTDMVIISGRHNVAARKLTEHQRERRAEQREAARATLTYGELDTHVSKASLDASFATQEQGESQAEADLSPTDLASEMRPESPAGTTDARHIKSSSLTPPSPTRRPLQGPGAGDSELPTPSTPTISPPGILKRWSPKRGQSPGARLRTRRVSFNLESNTSHILPELELDDAAGAYGPFSRSIAKSGRPRASLGLGRQRAGPARRRIANTSKGSPRGQGRSPPQAVARPSLADRREAEAANRSSSAPWTNVTTSGSKAKAANTATSEAAAANDSVGVVAGAEDRTSASGPMRLSFVASAGMRKRSRLGTPRRASLEKPALQNRGRPMMVAGRTADEQAAAAATAAKPGAATERLDGAEAGEQEDALLHREHSQPVKRSLRMAMLEADPPTSSASAHMPVSETSSTAERPAKRPHSAAREAWSSSFFAKKPLSAPGRLVGSSRARKLAALAQRTASMEQLVTSESGYYTQQSGDGSGAARSRPGHATASPFKGAANRMEPANGMAEMTPNTARTAHAGATPLRTTSVVPNSGNTMKTAAKAALTDRVLAGGAGAQQKAVSTSRLAADPAAGVRRSLVQQASD